MAIRITPFTVGSTRNLSPSLIEDISEEKIKKNDPPVTYWGIYLDDKKISYTSSKELAEKTKLWMEKWLSDKHSPSLEA
jgi:hypothetical protein